jgi:hypothetical protein
MLKVFMFVLVHFKSYMHAWLYQAYLCRFNRRLDRIWNIVQCWCNKNLYKLKKYKFF